MPCPVDQVLRVLVCPVALRGEQRMVAKISPGISRAVHEEQAVSGKVEVAVDVPPLEIGRWRNGVVFSFRKGPVAPLLRVLCVDDTRYQRFLPSRICRLIRPEFRTVIMLIST